MMIFFDGDVKVEFEEGFIFRFGVWGVHGKNICRNVDPCSQSNGLELGIRVGSDNIIFNLSLWINVQNNHVSGRNQFVGLGIFE